MIRSSIAIIGLGLALTGCAAKQELAGFYERHEATLQTNQPHTIHRVRRGDHELHVREYAPTGEVSSSPIILMHGFPDSSHLYDRLAPLLAAERQVIAFDFLGWGLSDTPDDHVYDVASLRRDLDVVISHFDFDKVTLVVHDASGPPGIDWTLDHPSRAAGLVLLNTLYAPSKHRVLPPTIERLSTPGSRRNLLAFGINRSDGQWQQGLTEQVGEFFVDPEMRDTYTKVFAHQALAIRPAFLGLTSVWKKEVQAREERLSELLALQVPTKIIFGAEDPYLTADLAREFDSLLPNSELHLIANAGHYVQLDNPEAVAKAVLAPWPGE